MIYNGAIHHGVDVQRIEVLMSEGSRRLDGVRHAGVGTICRPETFPLVLMGDSPPPQIAIDAQNQHRYSAPPDMCLTERMLPSSGPRTEMKSLLGCILVTRLSIYVTAPLRPNEKERLADVGCDDARFTAMDGYKVLITSGDVYKVCDIGLAP
ncbi:hypothetical protein M422DRAFT_248576 [Sphaerobolus stellatus SS14]|nr:hypothetical protein M422DRAFT_248576 [Sphaerobolus stellatus SS14]